MIEMNQAMHYKKERQDSFIETLVLADQQLKRQQQAFINFLGWDKVL
jgi:hypothetical protein